MGTRLVSMTERESSRKQSELILFGLKATIGLLFVTKQGMIPTENKTHLELYHGTIFGVLVFVKVMLQWFFHHCAIFYCGVKERQLHITMSRI